MDGLMTADAVDTVEYGGAAGEMSSSAHLADHTDWEGWLTEHGTAAEPGGHGESTHFDPQDPSHSAYGATTDPYDSTESGLGHEAQSQGYPAIDGWQDSIRQLADWGVTPEQLAAELQAMAGDGAQERGYGQPTEPGPVSAEEQFSGWLTQREVNPEECTRAELVSLEGAWRQEQMLAHYHQQTAAAQEHALRAQWHADLQGVEAAFPEFSNPVLRDALLNLYEGRYGIDADYDQLAGVAEELAGTIRSVTQAELARYAQNKQADALFPVFAGGSSPAPHGGVDFHQLSPTMQQEYLESHFAAVGGA